MTWTEGRGWWKGSTWRVMRFYWQGYDHYLLFLEICRNRTKFEITFWYVRWVLCIFTQCSKEYFNECIICSVIKNINVNWQFSLSYDPVNILFCLIYLYCKCCGLVMVHFWTHYFTQQLLIYILQSNTDIIYSGP